MLARTIVAPYASSAAMTSPMTACARGLIER
jgi:hypothetical protein